MVEKKIFDDFEESLKKFSDNINARLTRQKMGIHASFYSGVRTKKGRFRYGLSINSFKGGGEDITKYCKIFPWLAEVSKLAMKLAWKPDKGSCCTGFYFDEKKYKLGGELILPTTLSSSSILTEKLGIPSLSGFDVKFDKSPVGLERVEIDTSKEYGIVQIRCTHSFKPSDEKDMFRVSFNKSLDLANLFMVKK